jgi:hypothetical protein
LTVTETATVLALDGAGHADPGRPAGMSGDQAVVHQAAGMVSVQLEVRVEMAFARLRACAFAHDRRLSEAARAVVERRLPFHPDDPHGAVYMTARTSRPGGDTGLCGLRLSWRGG